MQLLPHAYEKPESSYFESVDVRTVSCLIGDSFLVTSTF